MPEIIGDLTFPPMLRGIMAPDPRAAAIAQARAGCDGGLICWRGGDALEVGLVLAPDVTLSRAIQMLPLSAMALRDALGAIGPPELPIHLTWDGRILLNGAEAGRSRIIASSGQEDAVPDWVVNHLIFRFLPVDDGMDVTALWSEGGGDVTPEDLLESWSRHLLHRLSEWDDGPESLHVDLTGCSWERESKDAAFIGLDESFGRLRRDGDATTMDPLTDLLETP